MYKKILIIVFFLTSTLSLFPQPYGKGAILDYDIYDKVPQKAATRDITPLPRSISLKQYTPIPESQGEYGTCAGWATAFAARTISESVGLKRTDRELTKKNVFSPVHAYKNVSDNDGRNGAVISYILDYMRDKGAVKRRDEELSMKFPNIPITLFAASERYPIRDYVRLFSNGYDQPGMVSERVSPVKKSIAAGKPVIIGMNCPNSFYNAKGVWKPEETPYEKFGGHAMCVIGYDDDMYGGAFEIQNSWGTGWGNDGYIWITYSDFAHFVGEAYEMIDNFFAYQKIAEFSGSVEIEMRGSSARMEVEFVNEGYYKTKKSHPSGTLFRYLMNCGKPAYVYAFAADASSYTRIFPAQGFSAVLAIYK